MWQLARALWALGARVPAAVGAPAWLAPFVACLLAFWVFDHGVTALQLPWVSGGSWAQVSSSGNANWRGAAAAHQLAQGVVQPI